jgi:plastocyanin
MNRRIGIAARLAIGLAVVLGPASCGKGVHERTVPLHMSGYAFNDSNPTLVFEAGERVRFLVRNDETTMIRHNFRIVALDVRCDYELGPGEERAVAVTMPDTPGVFPYDCCTHQGMGGSIEVKRRTLLDPTR